MDGIDIDWEFPKNGKEAKDYVELLKVTREGLDQLAERKGEQANGYELTIAAVSSVRCTQWKSWTDEERMIAMRTIEL